jgi:hypothetical protein
LHINVKAAADRVADRDRNGLAPIEIVSIVGPGDVA